MVDIVWLRDTLASGQQPSANHIYAQTFKEAEGHIAFIFLVDIWYTVFWLYIVNVEVLINFWACCIKFCK